MTQTLIIRGMRASRRVNVSSSGVVVLVARMHPSTNAGMPTAAPPKECPKCGIIKKSSISSCCARGGAWFRKCGDAGNLNFDHTWGEGIQACKARASSLMVEVREQDLLEGMIDQTINWTNLQNADQQHGNVYLSAKAVDVSTADNPDYLKLAGIISVGSLIVNLRSYL